jgi:Zn-dependent protease with chaperone function
MKSKLFGISMVTITCLYGLLAAVILLIFKLIGADMLIGIYISIAVLVIQFLISPWLTDLSMRLFYKADFNATLPEYLKTFLFDECKKYNMKNPKVAVINDGGPNAFTYGRTKNDARIVITRGIYELLTEDEVKAVVAHELGHVVHYDMLFMTAVQVVPLVLYAIYEAFARSSRGDNDDNKAAMIGWIAYILYVISQYIILWLSRTREYYADEFSLEETKNPNSLASAFGFPVSCTENSSA